MRILAVGAFSVPVVHENWREPLERLYGVTDQTNTLFFRLGIMAQALILA